MKRDELRFLESVLKNLLTVNINEEPIVTSDVKKALEIVQRELGNKQ